MEITTLSFSSILLKIKKDFKLTNADIADVFHCDESTISLYLNNKTPISIDKAVLLKSYLLEKYNVDIYSKHIFDFEDNGYYFHGVRTGIKGDISLFFSNK